MIAEILIPKADEKSDVLQDIQKSSYRDSNINSEEQKTINKSRINRRINIIKLLRGYLEAIIIGSLQMPNNPNLVLIANAGNTTRRRFCLA